MKLKSILTILCFAYISASSIDIYPEWFIYPKFYPECVIGFSFQNKLPVEDAEYMFCYYQMCTVTGSEKNIDINSVDYFKNIEFYYHFKDYKYLIDGNKLDSIRDSLVSIDGFCNDVLSKGFIQLFTLNKELEFEKKEIITSEIPKPKWVKKTFWKEGNYFYGVGMYSSYFNENEAWKISEESAIYNVFSSVQAEITAKTIINSTEDDDIYLNTIKNSFEFTLINIECYERWIDFENDVFYTLIRIRQENISANSGI